MMRTCLLLTLLCGGLLLTACEDPSNVGIGLVDDTGNPEIRTLPSTFFEPISLEDVTGAAQRVLAGRVDDALFGTLTATGYVDFQSTFDNTDEPTISGVTLHLARDYVYGDTTATVTLNLYDLADDWVATGSRADTSLSLGALITSFDFLSSDTLVTAALPEAWIVDNDTTLRSTSFEAAFHGFALEAVTSEAVVGFDAAQSFLRVFTEQDTLDYPLVRTLSGLARTGEPLLPANRLAVQDGLGPSIKFNFDLTEYKDTPIHGAFIRIFADTLALQDTPSNFVRPPLERVQLVAAEEDDSIFLLSTATLTSDGYYIFDQPPTGDVLSLRGLLQLTSFDTTLFTHFELRTPFDDNTINAMLFFDATVDETAPKALLTITPIDN